MPSDSAAAGSTSSSTRDPLLQQPQPLQQQGRLRRWCGAAVSMDAAEVRMQLLFALPMMLTNVSYYAIPLISVMFAGHLGELELAGSTLANSWASVTGFALMVGLSGSLETLCGQGYGAKLYSMMGIYLQASAILSFLCSILVSILWYYSDSVLVLLQQDPDVSRMAGIYLKHLIPGLFAYALLQCMLRFLQTQKVVVPLVVCSLVPLLLHFGITHLLVHVLGLGFKGAALAAALSLWVSFVMLALYINFSKRFEYTWEGLSVECLRHVIPNLKLAVPSAVMVCLEFWAFEFLVLLGGLMQDSETSTSVIAMCVNTEAIIYNVVFGFAAVVSTRVSNELGAGNSNKAKMAVGVTLKLAVGLCALILLLLGLGSNVWAHFFSNSTKITQEFVSLTPLLVTSLLLDSAQGVLSGVSRGCGWQHLAAWTNLGAFYLIGMPLSILFGFVLDLQVKGLWMGLICGLLCQGSILLIITIRCNWEKLELSVEDKRNDPLLG